MLSTENNGISVAKFKNTFDPQRIVHGFSTRREGLNMSNSMGQGWDAVHEDRSCFLSALGLDYSRTIWVRQVHGTQVVVVDKNTRPSLTLEADALVTDRRNVPLLIVCADCVPILLYDPVREVVGAAHAGWRGTVACVAEEAVKAMEKAYGCLPQNIHAGIGPSIGPCCYEVGEEVISAYLERFPQWQDAIMIRYGSKAKLSLWESNRRQLLELGVPAQNIEVAGSCTSCNTDLFYSERKEGRPSGRFCSVISVL
ncbi:MAG: peptidoglycan editing factor PgeF [Dehalococcoidia bacterium]|nr:peptidoglycan editing factor PgeF [Dehalococcoidia bacterium]